MRFYRLKPKNNDTSHRNWAATTLKDECWVLAESEADARQKVGLATGILTRIEPGQPNRTNPWMTGSLTDCMPDNTPGREPPPGIILTARETIVIPVFRA